MTEVYEVFRKGSFTAVVKVGSKAAKKLWQKKSGVQFRGDIRAESPSMGFPGYAGNLGLIEQAGRADVWNVE